MATIDRFPANTFGFISWFGAEGTVSDLPVTRPKGTALVFPTPTNLTGERVDLPSSVRLIWQINSTDETGFEIERSLTQSSGYAQVGTVGPGINTFIDTGLDFFTDYYYRIRASFENSNFSAYSNIVLFRQIQPASSGDVWAYSGDFTSGEADIPGPEII